MRDLERLWPKSAFRFGGGGGGQASAIQSAPVPLPAPPVTADSADVIQAQQDLANQNMLKKSVKKTIVAGDTGGFVPGQPAANPSATGYKAKFG